MSETKNPSASASSKLITELKVSGQLMALDTGLWCVFTAPGSPIPDAQTGLPGVRVSLPPGPASRPDMVTITTFRDDGWIAGWTGAALVRVLRGPAHILVTIHQAPNATQDAPKLQVIKLADAASLPPTAAGAQPQTAPRPAAPPQAPMPPSAAPQAGAAPTAAKAPVSGSTEIIAHVQGRGDIGVSLTETMGHVGSKQWIEGFSITPRGDIGPGDIEYQAVLGRGWLSPWAEGGQFCGSRGMSLPILGLRVRLRGEAADHYDCVLEASFVDGTVLSPISNGDPAQADSLAPLESFKVTIVPRDSDADFDEEEDLEEEEEEDDAPPPRRTSAPAPKSAAKAKPAAKPAAKAPAKSTSKSTTKSKSKSAPPPKRKR